jgi:uncharacterized membrane protein
VITDFIVIGFLVLIAGLSHLGDKMCYRWRGIHYRDLVISYAIPIEGVGVSGVLVFVLSVETGLQMLWIVTCVLALSFLALEIRRGGK